jgi:hypothetical protein
MRAHEFYRRWLSTALGPAWAWATGTFAALVGLGVGVLGKFYPAWQRKFPDLTWELPLVALGLLFVYRLGLSPYKMHQKEADETAALAKREEQLLAELATKQSREAQAVKDQELADFLTEKYQYAVNQLMNQNPPGGGDRGPWLREVGRWKTEVLEAMKRHGCTKQELNHVETIATIQLGLKPEELAEHAVFKRFALTVGRVADISTEHAKRAAEARNAG